MRPNRETVSPAVIMTESAGDVLIKNALEITLLPGVGAAARAWIRDAAPDVGGLFRMNAGALAALGLGPEACAALRARAGRGRAREIFERAGAQDYRFLVLGTGGYPGMLAEIFDPPLVLYVRGNPETLLRTCVAVVGTRKPSLYGLRMAEDLASDLAARGITVVSGMARGVDAAAHRGALAAGGTTAAVLGSGIDVIYPREHAALAREIARRGVLLTEYPPGTPPAPRNFPARNRIVSGLALGALIVEAATQSGSLITARLAADQGREVFAVPGNVTAPQSFGPNFLIKQGAKLVQSWRDIVEEFPPRIRREIELREDAPLPEPEEPLPDGAGALLGLLARDEPVLFDDLHRRSGTDISRLSALLLDLEAKGRVRQLPGNYYVKLTK